MASTNRKTNKRMDKGRPGPGTQTAREELAALYATVEKALGLCTQERADEIIGFPVPEEHGALIKAMQANHQMLWMMAKGNGLRQTPATLRMGAQSMAISLSLVHYAFALGVEQGRSRKKPRARHVAPIPEGDEA